MKRKLLILVALMAVVCWLPGQAAADDIYGNTPYQGYLTSFPSDHFGIIATDGWADTTIGTADSLGFKIQWEVTNVGGDFPYQYSYIISNAIPISDINTGALSKGLSHWILQITSDIGLNAFDQITGIADGDPTTYSAGGSNPGMPAPIYGFKFDGNSLTGPLSFSFLSTQAPVWGNFYAKDGDDKIPDSGNPPLKIDVTAWNTGLDPNYSGDKFYIGRPNGVVPLPGAVLLLGAGLVRLAAYARRRKED